MSLLGKIANLLTFTLASTFTLDFQYTTMYGPITTITNHKCDQDILYSLIVFFYQLSSAQCRLLLLLNLVVTVAAVAVVVIVVAPVNVPMPGSIYQKAKQANKRSHHSPQCGHVKCEVHLCVCVTL